MTDDPTAGACAYAWIARGELRERAESISARTEATITCLAAAKRPTDNDATQLHYLTRDLLGSLVRYCCR